MLLHEDRQPGSRYLWFFSIPMVARQTAGSEPQADWLAAEERAFLRDLREDLEVRKPPIIFIHAAGYCQGCRPGFALLNYLEGTGALKPVLDNYARLPDVTGFAVFLARDRLARDPRERAQ
jgi:hypothetical protein